MPASPRFDYVLDKIRNAPLRTEPFRHLYIEGLFQSEHFAALTAAPEIGVPVVPSDDHLFDALFESGYKIIDFPGCVTNRAAYIRWHRNRAAATPRTTSTCEGFGVTLRLMQARSGIVTDLMGFLNDTPFQEAIAERFGISLSDVFYDSGIQKYLDGYEISPHPDVRKKALTYMVNVNPARDSERRDHHTHYLRLRPPYRHVQTFWEGNPDQDRCWLPWDWCETVTEQRANNSLVIFSPSDDTLHGVKTRYDHLDGQRTQLYGNLWRHVDTCVGMPGWEDFDIRATAPQTPTNLRSRVASALPDRVREYLKEEFTSDRNVVRDRLKPHR